MKIYQSGDIAAKRLAIRSLKNNNEKSLFSFFVKAFEHNDPFIRRHALEGISGFQTKEALNILKMTLADPSPSVVRHSVLLLNRFPFSRVEDALLPLLSHEDVLVRSGAIDDVGHAGSREMVFYIAPHLNDPEESIRTLSYRNIGVLFQKYRMGFVKGLDADFKVAVKQNTLTTLDKITEIIVPSFKEAWKTESNTLRVNALWCIGVITEAVLERLETYLMFEEEKELIVLGETIQERVSSLFPILKQSYAKISKGEKDLKWRLISSLGKFGNEDVFSLYIEGLKDNSFLVRAESVRGLMELDRQGSILEILPLLNDPVTIVRIRAIEAVGQMGAKEEAPQLITLLEDKDIQIKWRVIKALGFLQNKEAVQPLISLLRSENDAMIRSIAARSLGNLGFAEAMQPLIEAAHDSSYTVREQIGQALVKLENRKGIFSTLTTLLSDKNKYVRRSALNSIFIFLRDPEAQPKFEKALPFIIASLDDKDSKARLMASEYLKKRGRD